MSPLDDILDCSYADYQKAFKQQQYNSKLGNQQANFYNQLNAQISAVNQMAYLSSLQSGMSPFTPIKKFPRSNAMKEKRMSDFMEWRRNQIKKRWAERMTIVRWTVAAIIVLPLLIGFIFQCWKFGLMAIAS